MAAKEKKKKKSIFRKPDPQRYLVVPVLNGNSTLAYCVVEFTPDFISDIAKKRAVLNIVLDLPDEASYNFYCMDYFTSDAMWMEEANDSKGNEIDPNTDQWAFLKNIEPIVPDEDFEIDCSSIQITKSGFLFTACLKHGSRDDTWETPELSWELFDDLKAMDTQLFTYKQQP